MVGDVGPTGVQRQQQQIERIDGSYADDDEGSRRQRRRKRRDALAASHGSTQRNAINDQRGGDDSSHSRYNRRNDSWSNDNRNCDNAGSNDGSGSHNDKHNHDSWCNRWNDNWHNKRWLDTSDGELGDAGELRSGSESDMGGCGRPRAASAGT